MTQEEFVHLGQTSHEMGEFLSYREHLWALQLAATSSIQVFGNWLRLGKCKDQSFLCHLLLYCNSLIYLVLSLKHILYSRGPCFTLLKLYKLLSKLYWKWNEKNCNGRLKWTPHTLQLVGSEGRKHRKELDFTSNVNQHSRSILNQQGNCSS